MQNEAHVQFGTALIDLDASPLTQEGRWGSVTHIPQGALQWKPERALLYRTDTQISGRTGIRGKWIWKHVFNLPTMNACAVDYFLLHQECIPEDWQSFHLHFWGTIFRESKGDEFVRGLVWKKGRWYEIDTLLDGYGWTARCAAICYPGLMSHATYKMSDRLCA